MHSLRNRLENLARERLVLLPVSKAGKNKFIFSDNVCILYI